VVAPVGHCGRRAPSRWSEKFHRPSPGPECARRDPVAMSVRQYRKPSLNYIQAAEQSGNGLASTAVLSAAMLLDPSIPFSADNKRETDGAGVLPTGCGSLTESVYRGIAIVWETGTHPSADQLQAIFLPAPGSIAIASRGICLPWGSTPRDHAGTWESHPMARGYSQALLDLCPGRGEKKEKIKAQLAAMAPESAPGSLPSGVCAGDQKKLSVTLILPGGLRTVKVMEGFCSRGRPISSLSAGPDPGPGIPNLIRRGLVEKSSV